jgi:hypothetical protein
MTDGFCDICKKRDRSLISVVSKATLFHVCSDCFFERFMTRREMGVSMFEDVCPSGAKAPLPLEHMR